MDSFRLLLIISCSIQFSRIMEFLVSFAGSIESSTFFGVVLGFVGLGLVLFLYIQRKWCFNTTNRNWCEENVYPTAKYAQKIGKLHGNFKTLK